MLNTFKIGGNTTKVSFNSPSTGIIQKSHTKSSFVRCQVGSPLSKEIFSLKYGSYFSINDEKIFITVLQIMVFGGNELLCEIVKNEDLIEKI